MYTYYLNPLTASTSLCQPAAALEVAPPISSSGGQDIAGWELKLIMEYCNEVGRGWLWERKGLGGCRVVTCA